MFNGVKQKNQFYCEYKSPIKIGTFAFIHSTAIHQNKQLEFLVTHNNKKFVRGFLYIDGKEYPILEYNVYQSLQIENLCYDNIIAIRLSNEFAENCFFVDTI